MKHCKHWDEGDGDCCKCGQPNWCGDDGNTPEALKRFEDQEDNCQPQEER